MTIQELIDRLENATEGAFHLDDEIHDYLIRSRKIDLIAYTRVVDAAVKLIPAGWMIDHLGDDGAGQRGDLKTFGCTCELGNGDAVVQGQAPTRPLAICIAALKVMAANEPFKPLS